MKIVGTRVSKILAMLCLLMTFVSRPVTVLQAQDKPERRALKRVAPKYPEDFRKQQLGGMVRLNVVIAPDGSVTRATPISGNQTLVDSAIEAVKQWKFEPSHDTDTIMIQFQFDPREN